MNGIREFSESTVNALLDRVGRGVSRMQERKQLPYDLLESDEAYLVVFDAPGATSSDVQVRFVEGAVEVRVDRFRDFYENFEMRFPGRGLSLTGRVSLPDDGVVPRDASATLTDSGTLHVRIPKDPSKVTDVEVTDAEDVPEEERSAESVAVDEVSEDADEDVDDLDESAA
jgi:HSP20 family molecular chaperone IbpA